VVAAAQSVKVLPRLDHRTWSESAYDIRPRETCGTQHIGYIIASNAFAVTPGPVKTVSG
jgi:hypothetical protein